MPYRSGRTSMFVLLPRDQGTGRELDEMVQRLNPSTLTAALTDTHEQTVHLKFPKFKFEKKIDSALQQVFSLLFASISVYIFLSLSSSFICFLPYMIACNFGFNTIVRYKKKKTVLNFKSHYRSRHPGSGAHGHCRLILRPS